MALNALMTVPLKGQPTNYSNSDPTLGDINVYNTTSAQSSLTMTLPPLGAGLQTIGAMMLVEKDTNDPTGNSVIFNCSGSDLFADGTNSLTLTDPGAQCTLEVISIEGVLVWKVISGLGGAVASGQTGTTQTSGTVSEPSTSQIVADVTRFGENLPTSTGYGAFGDDGLYGYGYADSAVIPVYVQPADPQTIPTPAVAVVNIQESTSSTTYTDLATTTDQVTVMIGASGRALVSISAIAYSSTVGVIGYLSCALSGSNTHAADDTLCISLNTVAASNAWSTYSWTHVWDDLEPGLTTFKLKYKIYQNIGSPMNYDRRRISVMPL